jgi:hypothetical protein
MNNHYKLDAFILIGLRLWVIVLVSVTMVMRANRPWKGQYDSDIPPVE